MAEFASSISVGDCLLAKGLVTQDQLEAAQEKQWREGGEVEEHLVSLGYVTEEDMTAFLCDAYHFRFLRLDDLEIEREAIHHIPAAVAHGHCVLPIRRIGNSLAVVMADPLSAEAIVALKRVTDFDIIPFLADREAIERALFLHYGLSSSAEAGSVLDAELPNFLTRSRNPLAMEGNLRMGQGLNPEKERTFETFVRDANNEFAFSVARIIAEGKAEESANPFVCFGEEGAGKSHLLMAMANWITVHTPERRFIYTTGRRFHTEYLEALKENRVNLFRYFYREPDLLFVDDFDELFDRLWAQDELFETYQALHRNGGWLVMACRADPRKAAHLLPKLKSVLEEGIIGYIGPYSLESKVEILVRRHGGIPIPSEVFVHLIKRADGTMNGLLDILEQLVAISITGKREIGLELAEEVLGLMGMGPSSGKEDFLRAFTTSTTQREPLIEEPSK